MEENCMGQHDNLRKPVTFLFVMAKNYDLSLKLIFCNKHSPMFTLLLKIPLNTRFNQFLYFLTY